jgi:hypothetical protein
MVQYRGEPVQMQPILLHMPYVIHVALDLITKIYRGSMITGEGSLLILERSAASVALTIRNLNYYPESYLPIRFQFKMRERNVSQNMKRIIE